LQLVDEAALRAGLDQRRNRDVEIAVLAAEQGQPFAQFLFVHANLSRMIALRDRFAAWPQLCVL
jgi:hypothetical protein